MIRIEARDLPLPSALIEEMKATAQNPRYHAEGNVYNHTLMVVQQYEAQVDDFDLTQAEREILYWAAVLHDTGKPRVTRWTGERWTAQGHERASLPIARDLLLAQPGISPAQRRQILDLVRWHHIPLRWGLQGRPLAGYKRLATRLDLRLLGIFARFDLSGRICVDKGEVLHLIDVFNRETVPRITYELGEFGLLQAYFAQAPFQLKNALWYALRQENTPLLEKLLTQPPRFPLAARPRFSCHLCVGGTASMLTAAAQRRPAALTFSLDELACADHTDPHTWQLALRPLKHLLSVYAQAGKSVLLTARWIGPHLRREIAAFVRQLDGHLSYTCLETSRAQLLTEASAAPCLDEQYTQMDWPHPWEAHDMSWA